MEYEVLLQARVSRRLAVAVDKWRAKQPDVPQRAEAVRRLLAKALATPKRKPA